MTSTNLYWVNSDNEKVPVYKYEFDYREPGVTDIIFHANSVETKICSVEANAQIGDEVTLAYYSEGAQTTPVAIDPSEFKEIKPVTYYYADAAAWGAENTQIHLWGNGWGLSDWGKGPSMTATGKYARASDGVYPVYSVTVDVPLQFMSKPAEQRILFYCQGKWQTGDLTAVDGALYYGLGNKVVTEPIANPVFYAENEIPYKSIYLADTDDWGIEGARFHMYEKDVSHGWPEWQKGPKLTDTGKYAHIGDVWAKVYRYDYSFWADNMTVIAHNMELGARETGECPEVEGGLYYFNGQKKPLEVIENPVLFDEIPAGEKQPATLYLFLGANQMIQNLWWTPCAHVYRKDVASLRATDPGFNLEAWYEDILPKDPESEEYEREKMTYVSDGVYKYEVEDITGLNDVIFYYGAKNSEGEWSYKGKAHPASRGYQNDPTSWATYIYAIGLDNAHQSYVTPEEYEAQWEGIPEHLMVTGNQVFTGDEIDSPEKAFAISSDEGVFIHKLKLYEGDVATFNLSRFNAVECARNHGFEVGRNFDVQRGWATFNIGTVGCQPGDNQWYADHIWQDEERGSSRQVKIHVNKPMKWNNYTQYPWRIEPGEGGIEKDKDYWLVIDLHDDDHTVTLLEFDPTPGVTARKGELQTFEVAYPTARMLHDPELLEGTDANGEALFGKVNYIEAEVDIVPVGNELLKDGRYNVVYTVYLNGVPVQAYSGATDAFTAYVPYTLTGDKCEVAVRARYTENEELTSFCSHFVRGTVDASTPALPAPAEAYENGVPFYYNGPNHTAESPEYYLGGAVRIPYNVESVAGAPSAAVYADYSLVSIKEDGEDCPADHSIVKQNQLGFNTYYFPHWLGRESDVAWHPHAAGDDSEFGSEHDWSSLVVNEKYLPLSLPRISNRTANSNRNINSEAVLKLHAVYPFLTATLANAAEPVDLSGAVPGNMPQKAVHTGLPEDLSGYAVTAVKRSSDALATFNKVIPTGVESVDAIEGNGVTEWYTLNGIKLSGRPSAKGVYIERRGTESRKVTLGEMKKTLIISGMVIK